MKLKNKILLILLLFAGLFIFNNSNSLAATIEHIDASTLSLERLSYDFTKSIAEASDKSKMPADPNTYNHFLMVQASNGIYYLIYSTGDLKFNVNYDSSYDVNTFEIMNPNGYSFFKVIYDYKKSTFTYGSISNSSNYTITNRLNNESITGYYCSYPVYEYYNNQDTGFFLAKSEIIPLHTALAQVESQLYPEKILGTVELIIPAFLAIFSTLLVVFLLRSKIWLPI